MLDSRVRARRAASTSRGSPRMLDFRLRARRAASASRGSPRVLDFRLAHERATACPAAAAPCPGIAAEHGLSRRRQAIGE